MDTGFAVDIEALRLLGGRFGAAAEAVKGLAAQLADGAQLSSQALGLVAEVAGVDGEYRRQLQEALEGLDRLNRALCQVHANLAASADNYEASDRAVVDGLGDPTG